MDEQDAISSVDGTKFIYKGMVLDYDCSKDCYQEFQKGDKAGKFNLIDNEKIEEALENAHVATSDASGSWSRATAERRISAVRSMGNRLKQQKNDIVKVLMWDTDHCKLEATKEFDSTIQYIEDTPSAYEAWINAPGHTRRAPVGVVVVVGPERHSLLETYRMVVPALLTGNSVVVQIPCAGGLVHILTTGSVQEALPEHVLQYLLGKPCTLVAALMRPGHVAMLALAGKRELADRLIHAHPHPHSLRLHLRLECDILAVLTTEADLVAAAKEIAKGVLRSTHGLAVLKLVVVHRSIVEAFLSRLRAAVQEVQRRRRALALSACHEDPEKLQQLLIDALRKGAMVVNEKDGGGRLVPDMHGTVMNPAIVYSVNDTMQLWHCTCSGPIVAVTSYERMSEVAAYMDHSAPGLQVSVFARSPASAPVQEIREHAAHRGGSVVVNKVYLDGAEDAAVANAEEFAAFSRQTQLRAFPSTPSLCALDIESAGLRPRGGVNKEEEGLESVTVFTSPVSVTSLGRGKSV